MAADLVQASALGEIGAEAEKLLSGAIRPVVLVPRREDAPVAAAVADGLDTLGLMLPYTPVHHLLFSHGLGPMVMTSGNYSDEPLVKDNDSAVAHLGGIADAILLHDRPIERRIDDSVVQIFAGGEASVLRRARGYAPQPVSLGEWAEANAALARAKVLAVGAELNNTVCLFKAGRAVLSQHIGDLKDARTYRHFMAAIDHLQDLFEFTPELLAADMHPQYLCTEYAIRRGRGELGRHAAVPVVRVQHHHAHIVSCMAENGCAGPVIGLACDGVGYGEDGAVWGCEVLRAGLGGYERLGHLRYLPLIGGDAAAVQTYRPALAAMMDTFGADWADGGREALVRAGREQVRAAADMAASGVNCPPSSSLGRWFDAVAHLAGIADANGYEGQAPMKLEAVAADGTADAYAFKLREAGPFVIDLRPMVEELAADLTAGAEAPGVAAKFHNTVWRFLAASANRAREATGLNVVALSGGCFANRYLTGRLAGRLVEDGFEVIRHRRIPCNDGGVALGQAVVAAATARQ